MPQKTRGFINILLIFAMAAVSVLASALYVKFEVKHEAERRNLGATVYTTQLSDTINTFRQQVNSSTANLNTELALVSSTPNLTNATGSLTTGLTNITGQLPVSKGGTATSSLTSGAILTGNGTSSVSFLVPTQSGQLPISSGTTWTATPLTAGNNITITTSTGSISIAAASNPITKVFATKNTAVAQNATHTLIRANLPILAATTTVFHLVLTNSCDNSNCNGTSTLSFFTAGATTTILTKTININSPTVEIAEGSITMLGSTSSEMINLTSGQSNSPPLGNYKDFTGGTINAGIYATFSLNLSTTTTVTQEMYLISATSPTVTTNLLIYSF